MAASAGQFHLIFINRLLPEEHIKILHLRGQRNERVAGEMHCLGHEKESERTDQATHASPEASGSGSVSWTIRRFTGARRRGYRGFRECSGIAGRGSVLRGRSSSRRGECA